jgi:hypothetical protein
MLLLHILSDADTMKYIWKRSNPCEVIRLQPMLSVIPTTRGCYLLILYLHVSKTFLFANRFHNRIVLHGVDSVDYPEWE